jgi:hypothetical protein
MDQDQIETEAQIVREISATMFTDAVEIMAILDILHLGNEKARKEAHNKAGAGRAAGHIERSLFTRLHFLVARGYADKTRPGDLHARRAFDILKKPEVRKLVVERGTEEAMTYTSGISTSLTSERQTWTYPFLRTRMLSVFPN